nr:uncharacterized protein LOC112995098 [Dromaius novaehollandiae]
MGVQGSASIAPKGAQEGARCTRGEQTGRSASTVGVQGIAGDAVRAPKGPWGDAAGATGVQNIAAGAVHAPKGVLGDAAGAKGVQSIAASAVRAQPGHCSACSVQAAQAVHAAPGPAAQPRAQATGRQRPAVGDAASDAWARSVTAPGSGAGPFFPATESEAHLLQEVLFCQPDLPSLGLAVTFDSDQLFWFDFPFARWVPRLPELPPWPSAHESPAELLQDAELCQNLRRYLSALAEGILPEAKGIPMADVFATGPLRLGSPTTLVCMVGNLFPAAVSISWQRGGVPVTEGVGGPGPMDVG